MRIARVKLNKAASAAAIFGICVFALASMVSVGVVDAHDPVVQASQPDTASSVSKVDVELKSTSSPNARSAKKPKRKAFKIRRKVVIDFVGQQFPELQKSLLKWEKKSPVKFRNAISRLETDVVRLRNLEERRPAKFELMVDLWKLKTQIEITIAKYAKKESDSQLEARLKPLAEQILDIRTSIANLEREFAIKRISVMDERLLHFENDRERIIENNMRSFQKSADNIRAKKKERSLQRQSLPSESKTNSKTNSDSDSQSSEENP